MSFFAPFNLVSGSFLTAPPLISNCLNLPLGTQEGHHGWGLAYKKWGQNSLHAWEPTEPHSVSGLFAGIVETAAKGLLHRLSDFFISYGSFSPSGWSTLSILKFITMGILERSNNKRNRSPLKVSFLSHRHELKHVPIRSKCNRYIRLSTCFFST